jgi:small subunit ribosomal protein S20
LANHKSAVKRARQNTTRKNNNKWKKTRVRSTVKALRGAVAENNKEEANGLFKKAQSLIAKLGKTSAMKKKTAARLTSRLAKAANKTA